MPRLIPPPKLDSVLQGLADKKKGITDDDILALVGDEVHQAATVWDLVDLQVVCGTMGMPTCTVQLRGPDGITRVSVGVGAGRYRHLH